MEPIDYFVPGERGRENAVVSHLRWPIPVGVAQVYVEAYTAPGELVLVPYCQGPAVVREIIAARRRVLALNFDPLLVLAVQAELSPLPARELDAAVARLGDSLKQGIPLRHYLERLYATTCPACLRPVVADYFIWDRDQGTPVAKSLRCGACAWDGRAAVEAEDLERLAQTPARGMHYHYILDRVAPHPEGDALRPRVEMLLELYSSRNLYALAELSLKIEALFPAGPLQRALKVLLLDCLDRCSALAPLPDSMARRRGLARPGRYLERNVWRTFEEAASRWQALAGRPLMGLIDSLAEFQAAGEAGAGFVGQALVRDLSRLLPPRSMRLILTSPPPLDSAAWSLSYLWGAWLLGAEAAEPLRPLLRQRTPDPAWYARVMAGSLRTLGSLLREEGRLVLVLTGQRPALVEALLLAAGQARLGVAALVQCGADYRLELTPALRPEALGGALQTVVPASPEPLEAQVRRVATEAAVETIRARGEPTPWESLHAAIYCRLAEAGLPARAAETEREGPAPLDLVAQAVGAALESPAFVLLPADGQVEKLWWLAGWGQASLPQVPPLSDRVEEAAWQVLHDALALTEADFSRAVYARFPGRLTPDAALVAACLASYGCQPTPGYWQLRAEDLPQARQGERRAIIEHLLALGRRLGYQAAPWEPFDAAWFKGAEVCTAFVVRWRAAVGEALALSDRLQGATPYLVVPGGRAALVSYKLAHNPLWQQAVDQAGWGFIKYRHVRQLAAQPEVDEYALRTIVGLDPIVERETAQIPLF